MEKLSLFTFSLLSRVRVACLLIANHNGTSLSLVLGLQAPTSHYTAWYFDGVSACWGPDIPSEAAEAADSTVASEPWILLTIYCSGDLHPEF